MAGPDDIAPSVDIQGTEEAADKLAKLGEAGATAFDKIAAAAAQVDKASTGITKLTTEGEAAFKNLEIVAAEAFGNIIGAAMSGNFTGLATHMFGEWSGVLVEATQHVLEFIDAQAQMAETLSNLASATGQSTSEILGMREAFASVGISTNGFERAIGRLAVTIANEWSQIQQAVRTSADNQTSAMLQVEQAAFNVQKSFTSMNEALSSAGSTAAHDALNIQEAAMTLRKAANDLADFSLTSRANALSVESAQLALTRARMNLQKDQGYAVNPADEKALKIEQDRVAVKDAELRLDEAKNKKAKEGMEMEELTLKVKKAKLDLSDAETKQQQDAIKGSDRIKQADLDRHKAQLALSETQEKQHQNDLKNIPAIAREIDSVAAGQKKWAEVVNATEISAGNLTKALILASSPGNGAEPKVMDVYREMSKLFQHMGDDADSMNKKLEIVQHTMGAGFRAGQASAAQLLAVLQRGPEAVEHFMEEMKKFGDSINLQKSIDSLKQFNSAFAQLEGAIDIVKSRFAGIMATPLAPFFDTLRESITTPGRALNTLVQAMATFLESLMGLVSHISEAFGGAVNPLFQALVAVMSRAAIAISGVMDAVVALSKAFSSLTGFKPDEVLGGWAVAAGLASAAIRGIAASLIMVVARMAGWLIVIGLVVTALGNLQAMYNMTIKGQSEVEAHNNKLENAGKQILNSATMGLTGGKPTGNDVIDKGVTNMMSKMGLTMEKAATKEEGAADKSSGAADKHSSAADKHSSAADKLGGGGDKLGEAAASVSSVLGGAGDKLSTAAAALSGAAASLVQAIANIGKSAGAKAGGGKISGPGGPRDDGAGLFALSDGEFVVQSAAVSHYGSGLFEALNSLSVGGFATGGAVGVSAPRTPASAGGGPSSVLNLTIDGQQFNGLKAPEHVATKLKTYAVGRQASSAGKMPTWMR